MYVYVYSLYNIDILLAVESGVARIYDYYFSDDSYIKRDEIEMTVKRQLPRKPQRSAAVIRLIHAVAKIAFF
jgi:deoxyhypusine synthase